MISLVIIVSISLAMAAIVEYQAHCRRLKAVPIRILVNGTRGKSTVTRLIAAGLAAGGLRVYAKTTGSAARIILPDLSEREIRKHGSAKRRPSIMEHKWFVRAAYKAGAQAIVAECMAIRPETIGVLETRLAHSTIGVITNVRLDHLDTMGTELESVAEALGESIPERGKAFVGSEGIDEEIKAVFSRMAAQRGSELIFVPSAEETQALHRDFLYPVHAQNMALALAVCDACGVSRQIALRGMQSAKPDPGVRSTILTSWRVHKVRVINAFAANDPQSTLEMWHKERGLRYSSDLCYPSDMRNLNELDSNYGPQENETHEILSEIKEFNSAEQTFRVLVFNHREDRAWRALQMGEIAAGIDADAILVYGLNRRLAQKVVYRYYRRLSAENPRALRAQRMQTAAQPAPKAPTREAPQPSPKAPTREAAQPSPHQAPLGPPLSKSQNKPASHPIKYPAVRSMRQASFDAIFETIENLGGFKEFPSRTYVEILCAGNIKGPGMALSDSLEALLLHQPDAAQSAISTEGAQSFNTTGAVQSVTSAEGEGAQSISSHEEAQSSNSTGMAQPVTSAEGAHSVASPEKSQSANSTGER
ncbi:MAG TPA: poly-gamma-glutamate synthase PgsB [Rectinema sp.]|nr:poly-gamma-glutamate synthase PgsB [Rectinema sp.]